MFTIIGNFYYLKDSYYDRFSNLYVADYYNISN
jgi:hypothetical protein